MELPALRVPIIGDRIEHPAQGSWCVVSEFTENGVKKFGLTGPGTCRSYITLEAAVLADSKSSWQLVENNAPARG